MNKYFAAFIISEKLRTPAQKNLPKWKLVICITVHYGLNWMYEFLYSKNLSDFKRKFFYQSMKSESFCTKFFVDKI